MHLINHQLSNITGQAGNEVVARPLNLLALDSLLALLIIGKGAGTG
jgi:hypothetical protein